jgi:ADP-heptose:LPS heptosyltransferase
LKLGLYRLRTALLRWAGPRSGPLARWARHPDPFNVPWKRAALDIVGHGNIGDVIMCTPSLRELKRHNPRCRVRFYSKFSPLVQGLPYIDEALPYETRPARAVYLDYMEDDDPVPPRARLIALMGDRLGLKVTDERLDCVIDADLVAGYRAAWRTLPRPHIVLARHASGYTPNKEWPAASWATLIERLSQRATVIEIGVARDPAVEGPATNYVDLRGRTSVAEMVAVIAAADLHVGPVSGPMHVAAVAKTPCVILYGGYEPAFCTQYAGNIALETKVPCAPCWLREPCPFALKCLTAITPATVEQSVWKLWMQTSGLQD